MQRRGLCPFYRSNMLCGLTKLFTVRKRLRQPDCFLQIVSPDGYFIRSLILCQVFVCEWILTNYKGFVLFGCKYPGWYNLIHLCASLWFLRKAVCYLIEINKGRLWSSRHTALPWQYAVQLVVPSGCRLPVAGCRLPVGGCRLPVAGCRLPVAGWRLWIVDCGLWVVGCGLRVAGCGLSEDNWTGV